MVEWVSAARALKEDRLSNPMGNSVVKWASIPSARRLLTRAEWVEGATWEQDEEGYFAIPVEFWAGMLLHPGSLYRDWTTGTFTLSGRVVVRAYPRKVVASGVQFSAVGLVDRLGHPLRTAEEFGGTASKQEANALSAPAPAAPPQEARKGGNPGKVDAWHRFYFEAMAMLDDGDLDNSKFATQQSLRDELRRRIDDNLSDDAVKPHVSKIWYKFVDRTG